MSLHKELVAAFRRAEPPEVEYPTPAVHSDEGCFWKKIDFSLVLNSSGEVIDVERPPWRMSGKRCRSSLLVPYRPFLGAGGLSGFLWGQSLHALGVGRSKRDGEFTTNLQAFNRFRAFHRAVLSEAKSPSIQAFVLFLQRWEPEALDKLGRASEAAGGAVVFRFQYENGFLHESHAARLIWARLLNPTGSAAKTPDAR